MNMPSTPERTAQVGAASNQDLTSETRANTEITPELVKQVSDKVFALFIAELKLENERCRHTQRRNPRWGGER